MSGKGIEKKSKQERQIKKTLLIEEVFLPKALFVYSKEYLPKSSGFNRFSLSLKESWSFISVPLS